MNFFAFAIDKGLQSHFRAIGVLAIGEPLHAQRRLVAVLVIGEGQAVG